MVTTCILLSAGTSSRFGFPKALGQIKKRTIIETTQNNLLQSNINNIIIVLGAEAERIQPFVLKHKRVTVVYNNHYNFGQTSSFKCGLSKVNSGTHGILLLPIDFPSVDVKTINLLIEAFAKKEFLIIIPSYNNQKGHPPIFDISLKKEFLELDNSEGINSVFPRYTEKTKILPVDDKGVILSFNTVKELEEIKVQTHTE